MTSGGDVLRSQSLGKLPSIPPVYKLDGRNYLKWARFVRTTLEGEGKISHLTDPGPYPNFKAWDEEDAVIMEWMRNSMIPEISNTCIFRRTAKDIWDFLYQTYFRAREAAITYELKVRTMTAKQGNKSVTEYAVHLKSLWAELDYCRVLQSKCPNDSAAIKLYIEQDRVYDFLFGLNPEFDQLRTQVLGSQEVPGFNEVISLIRREEIRRNAMLESQRSREFKNQNHEDLWCTYCQMTGHTYTAVFPPDEGTTKEQRKELSGFGQEDVELSEALISSLDTSTPAFGAATTPAFGSPTIPSFRFGQSSSAFGSSPFGTTSVFGAQSSFGGTQNATMGFGGSPGFGWSAFGDQKGGSRGYPYSPTPETNTGTRPAGKLESISAMPVYIDKSHEQLRWEDCQLRDKGAAAPVGSATAAAGFGSSGFRPSFTRGFCRSLSNRFSTASLHKTFTPKGKTPVSKSSSCGLSTTPAFGSSHSPFGSSLKAKSKSATAQAFGVNTASHSLFSSSSTPAFGSSSSFSFGSTYAPGTESAFGNTQSSPLFQYTAPTLPSTSLPSVQTVRPPLP